MIKVLLVLSLAIITTVVACGGSRMTVEEYAAACEELNNRVDDSGDSPLEINAMMEDVVAEVRRWNPPEELQEFHDTRVRAMEAAIDVLKDTGISN